MNILIDTNIALYLLGGDDRIAEVLEGQVVHVSFITELELLGYPNISKEEEKVIHDFLDDCVIIDVNRQIKDWTVVFRKKYGLKLPDAIIAATAYYVGRNLTTTFGHSFSKITVAFFCPPVPS